MEKKVIKLFRIYAENITVGHFMYENKIICHCFELPDLDNERRISCIPPGQYVMQKVKGHPRFGDCFLLLDVPNRSEIFIHCANKVTQLLGCIAPCDSLVEDLGGSFSRPALSKLWKICDHETLLEIE
jgi:hypothetical protein